MHTWRDIDRIYCVTTKGICVMMESREPGPAFENISQRVVSSYQRQLGDGDPVIPGHLSPSEQHDMQVAQRDLDGFFRAFYQCAYDHPEVFGLPLAEDVCVEEGDGKEAKQDVTKKIKKPRVKMAYGIDFLYFVGQQGALVNRHLRLDKEDYASFFAKSPRVKRKFIDGMQKVGLTVSEQDDAMVVGNTHYPNMMLALKALAEACGQRADVRMGKYLFARCDFRALEPDYQPDVLDMLRTVISPSAYEHVVELHHALVEMAYVPILRIGGVFEWRVQYQGKRAIKASPFFELEYDERQKRQLVMRVKCASTNRLVPLISQQPTFLQRDFFRYANNCGGSKCGWCKTRKGMGPSVLEYGGDKKTICWYMQRRFAGVDGEAVDLIKHYALLHGALVAA
jgi:hypothetical protein